MKIVPSGRPIKPNDGEGAKPGPPVSTGYPTYRHAVCAHACLQTWLQRVETAEAGPTMMTLAIDGLGKLQATDASEMLKSIVHNPSRATQVRVSSARAP